ncbi:nucleotidyltransferase domain-containing protein [Wukongibacter sp. M2B1]
MKDIFKITEIIKEKIEKKYSNDIAIFAYYGSYAMGLEEEKSDLDFFFIPKTEKGKELGLQFIIEDIGLIMENIFIVKMVLEGSGERSQGQGRNWLKETIRSAGSLKKVRLLRS